MRDRELDLIAALVEGRLEDESEARALIASGPDYRAEYEAQKLAFESLSSMGTVTLADTEKAALRRDIWTELRSGEAAKPAKAPWYYRWVPVAAGMFVVVGLVAVVSQGGGDDSGEAATFQEAASPLSDDATENTTAAAGAGDDGASESDADEEMTEPEASGDTAQLNLTRTLSPSEQQFFAEEAAKVRSGDLEGARLTTLDEEDPGDDLQSCIDSTDLTGYEAVGVSISAFISGESAESLPEGLNPFIAAIPVGADLEDAPVAFIELVTCDLIHFEE